MALRFGLPGRIQTPNSAPRSIAVMSLGESGAAILDGLARQRPDRPNMRLFGRPGTNGDDLHRALNEVDIILVVAHRGDDLSLVPAVSRVAHDRNAQLTAVYIVSGAERSSLAGAFDETLKKLRDDVDILVVAGDESYVAAMVTALID